MRMPERQRGISLVLTLVLMVVIALTAAASMRGVISGERIVNNARLEALAQQYAEIGLRYCEGQLTLQSAARVPTLQDAQLPAPVPMGQLLGQQSPTWTASPPLATTVPAAEVAGSDSTVVPPVFPQCFVDRAVLLPGGSTTFVVTARGFSPGYSARADGTTQSGAVVWLQSVVILN
jgi:hypothetical protein